ncbi:hypothetical protein MSG28_003281, partial [Choristoneura fumiferana]
MLIKSKILCVVHLSVKDLAYKILYAARPSEMTSFKKDFVFEPFKVTEVKFRGFECPRPRSGHRIACDDVNIYCFGGYNPVLPRASVQRENPTWTPERPLFKELWSFSIASRKWKEHKVVENMPEELASNAMCMNGRYLMIFGGTGAPFGNKCSNDVIAWKTSPGDAKLQVLEATGSRPPGQYGQAILCHDVCCGMAEASEVGEATTVVPGPHRSPTPELYAAYTTLEILVALVAIVGNAMVIHVFRRDRRLRRRTNYYIVSLAVADLLVGLLGIPFAILASVGLPRNLHACLFTVSLLVMLCTISIFCLVAVSVDRYWAILHPMCYSRNVRTKTAI